jgi:hypothetical protein
MLFSGLARYRYIAGMYLLRQSLVITKIRTRLGFLVSLLLVSSFFFSSSLYKL